MSNNLSALTDALQQWLAAQEGLGLILFAWLVFLSLLGGIVLMLIGIMLWSPWPFLGGLICLRLFDYCLLVGRDILPRLFPGE